MTVGYSKRNAPYPVLILFAKMFRLLVSILTLASVALGVTVNEDCKAQLTKLDSHMVAYVGNV